MKAYGRRAFARRITCGLTAVAALCWGMLAPSHVAAQSKEPIKIGAVLSLTGPGAGLGQAERSGIQLAEKAINDKGGIRGRPLQVLIEDDGSKADIAKSK